MNSNGIDIAIDEDKTILNQLIEEETGLTANQKDSFKILAKRAPGKHIMSILDDFLKLLDIKKPKLPKQTEYTQETEIITRQVPIFLHM